MVGVDTFATFWSWGKSLYFIIKYNVCCKSVCVCVCVCVCVNACHIEDLRLCFALVEPQMHSV